MDQGAGFFRGVKTLLVENSILSDGSSVFGQSGRAVDIRRVSAMIRYTANLLFADWTRFVTFQLFASLTP